MSANFVTLFLWEIIITANFFLHFFILFKILFSVFISNAEVASSNIKILGCFNNVMAKAILCLWPPEIFVPFSPNFVFKPFFKLKTNLSASATLNESLIKFLFNFLELPKVKLFKIVSL